MMGVGRAFPGVGVTLNGNVTRYHWPSAPFSKVATPAIGPANGQVLAERSSSRWPICISPANITARIFKDSRTAARKPGGARLRLCWLRWARPVRPLLTLGKRVGRQLRLSQQSKPSYERFQPIGWIWDSFRYSGLVNSERRWLSRVHQMKFCNESNAFLLLGQAVFAVAWCEPQIVLEYQCGPFRLICPQIGRDLLKQIERLAIVD